MPIHPTIYSSAFIPPKCMLLLDVLSQEGQKDSL